jgi:phycocyanobilin lyase alpha subunit
LTYEFMIPPSPTDTGISAESLTREQAIANLRSDDPSLRYYAAWWVGRFRVSDPAVVTSLIESLSYTADRTEDGAFPLQRNAARALGKLNDRRAVPPLIDCLHSNDYFVREAAVQSLAALGDAAAIPALATLLEGGVSAAEVVIPGKPHLVQPYDAVLEALGELGATDQVETIQPFLAHSVPKVSYAAARALYQLTGVARYAERLVEALQGDDLQLRRAVLADLGAIGYVPAARAIAQTLAENSLKLIALKKLIEHPAVQQQPPSPTQPASPTPTTEVRGFSLTSAEREIMTLMDELL